MSGLFAELRRRRVYQSAAIYAVAAWGLAQVIDFLAERLFMPEWLPTITAILFMVGFPVVIFLSWVFDFSREGIQRTGLGSIRGVMSILAAAVMLVGGTALIYAIVWPHRATEIAEAVADANSIAVLPFTQFGPQDESDYLSDGIAEEILFALGSLTDLRVAARTSSFSFRGQSKTASDIAKELAVRHIVEGSIRVIGDRLRVSVSLVRGDTNLELWSQSYEEPIDNIFDVQEDIAARVAEAVRLEMGAGSVGERPRFRAVSEDSEAYRLYLQGRFLWHQRGPDNIRAAIAYFQQALEREPEFAGAWAALSSAYLTAGTYVTGIEDHWDKAAQAARRALEFDASLGEPYGSLAWVRKTKGDLAEAERLIKEGIRLSPQNTSLRLWYATLLIDYGRSLDANRQAAIAIERDPAYPVLHANFAMSSFQLGKLDDAISSMQRAWRMGLRPFFLWYGILDVLVERGDYEAATAWFDEMPALRDPQASKPAVDADRAWVRFMQEKTQASRVEFERALGAYLENPVHGLDRAAYLLAAAGDGERALELKLQAATQNSSVGQAYLWVPAFSSARTLDGFNDLATVLGLVNYWRAVEWPDVCGPGENDRVVCYR